MTEIVPLKRRETLPTLDLEAMSRALAEASDAVAVHQIEDDLARAERLMRDSGRYALDEIRPINELHMRAAVKLGRLLAQIERETPKPGKTTSTGLTQFLKRLELSRQSAM